MSQVGNLGNDIIFETNDKRILTFNGMKRNVSGRWTLHNSIGGKQASEFLGPGLDSVTMQISICAKYGVRPREVIDRIEQSVKSGSVNKLVIGGKMVGKNPYKITSMSEEWNCIYQRGELYQANVTITLEEYA